MLKWLSSQEQEGRRGKAPNSPILYRWAIFVSVLCTLSNLAVFAYVTWGRSGTTIGYDTTRLPRPNQYIGLEKVNRKALNATLPKTIANFAPVLTQISKQLPTYIYPTDTRRYFVPNVGTVSPDDRHFFVDEHVGPFSLTCNRTDLWRRRAPSRSSVFVTSAWNAARLSSISLRFRRRTVRQRRRSFYARKRCPSTCGASIPTTCISQTCAVCLGTLGPLVRILPPSRP